MKTAKKVSLENLIYCRPHNEKNKFCIICIHILVCFELQLYRNFDIASITVHTGSYCELIRQKNIPILLLFQYVHDVVALLIVTQSQWKKKNPYFSCRRKQFFHAYVIPIYTNVMQWSRILQKWQNTHLYHTNVLHVCWWKWQKNSGFI